MRSLNDKIIGVGDESPIHAFNDFIGGLGLRDIHRLGGSSLGPISKSALFKVTLTEY